MWLASNECKLDESQQWFISARLMLLLSGEYILTSHPLSQVTPGLSSPSWYFFPLASSQTSVCRLLKFSAVNPYFSLFLKCQKSFNTRSDQEGAAGSAGAVEPPPLTGAARGRQSSAASAGEGLAGVGAPSLGSRAQNVIPIALL